MVWSQAWLHVLVCRAVLFNIFNVGVVWFSRRPGPTHATTRGHDVMDSPSLGFVHRRHVIQLHDGFHSTLPSGE